MAANDAEVGCHATSRAAICSLGRKSLQNSKNYGTLTTWPPSIKNGKKEARRSEMVSEIICSQSCGFDQL